MFKRLVGLDVSRRSDFGYLGLWDGKDHNSSLRVVSDAILLSGMRNAERTRKLTIAALCDLVQGLVANILLLPLHLGGLGSVGYSLCFSFSLARFGDGTAGFTATSRSEGDVSAAFCGVAVIIYVSQRGCYNVQLRSEIRIYGNTLSGPWPISPSQGRNRGRMHYNLYVPLFILELLRIDARSIVNRRSCYWTSIVARHRVAERQARAEEVEQHRERAIERTKPKRAKAGRDYLILA